MSFLLSHTLTVTSLSKMFSATQFKTLALAALLFINTVSAVDTLGRPVSSSAQCDSICQQVHDPNAVESIGRTIESSISSTGNYDILLGQRSANGVGYDASTIWKLWAKSLESSFSSSVSHLQESGHADDKVCIDKATLAKLTAASLNCHSHVKGSGALGGAAGGSVSWSYNTSGGDNPQVGWGAGVDTSGVNAGGDSSAFGSGSNVHHNVGGGSSSFTSTGGSTSTSSSGWGSGNVANGICFQVRSKENGKLLTTYGSEYAFARLDGYHSTFRAHPIKGQDGSFRLTEIKRNGATVSYPVKINSALGQFKPLYGDKDAVFTFKPTQFGDSCWGSPGFKMARRQDWGGWGPNYRATKSSSADECVDVELEEADC
ncbi:hypothetical protein IE81DRAFT_110616 [Ceraceosorus guamensis]|uniref:Uncharacterized protein n=1 Tax=Ceraceosorus guamensis TaxID=1522189 RepID=A0A316W267_9BASI|nr:hypothetical protein IE81DRAFT_110616 [Ceraceosorus guamensis]PWN42863.1 hypothetical protein IE81DRAFT_110616 [Ceraceosorus guamensis]